MNGCAPSALFPAHYGTYRVAATPHFSVYRLRERGRSSWTFVQGECHCRYLVAIQRLNEVVNTVIANARPSASPRLRRIPEPQNLLFAQGLERWELRGDYLLDAGGLHWQDYASGTDEMGPRPGMKSGYLKAQVSQPLGFADLRKTYPGGELPEHAYSPLG